MPNGKIKMLVPKKRVGFIKAEGGKDVFFDAAAVDGQFDELLEEQPVEYTLAESDIGPRASTVRLKK
jgi:cold shock CspA family protein